MARSPTPVRLTDDDESALKTIPGNRSEILKRGIHLQAVHERPMVPLYPHDVSEADIVDAIEEAANLATKRLDELFRGAPPEKAGISSNFQGLLVEHLSAMLTGREYSKKSYSRQLNSLYGDWRTFGRQVSAGNLEGITLLEVPDQLGNEQLFYDDDKKRFVPLAQLSVGALFTGTEAAVKAGFAWLRANELSPRERPLRLCVLSFAKDGPPTVVRIAEP